MNSKLGDYYYRKADGSYMVYTMRGWIRCDNNKELQEELNKLDKEMRDER